MPEFRCVHFTNQSNLNHDLNLVVSIYYFDDLYRIFHKDISDFTYLPKESYSSLFRLNVKKIIITFVSEIYK